MVQVDGGIRRQSVTDTDSRGTSGAAAAAAAVVGKSLAASVLPYLREGVRL